MTASGTTLHIVRDGRRVPLRLGAPTERADILVAGRLRAALTRGALVSGDRLPSEHDIAEALNLSRDPIHRALVTLAGENLVQSRPGSGWYVL